MIVAELLDILKSDAFVHELDEVSGYLSSVMQERPIQYLIAKSLWKAGREYELEFNKHDLTVDDRHIEIKFNYDFFQIKLRSELQKCNGSLDSMFVAQSNGFGVGPRICKDLGDKCPNIFIWIICSRDLDSIADEHGHRINFYHKQRGFTALSRSDSNYADLGVIDDFLSRVQDRLKASRPFTIHRHQTVTKGAFPSVYHFRICNFAFCSNESGMRPEE